MSVGSVGYTNGNADLWAKIQESTLSKFTGNAQKSQAEAPAAAPPAYHGVSGASPGSGWSKLNVMG